jgi:hypothetical protein
MNNGTRATLNGGSDIENAYLNGSSLDIQITAALDY